MTDRPQFVPAGDAYPGNVIHGYDEHGDVFHVHTSFLRSQLRVNITGRYWADDGNYPDEDESVPVTVNVHKSDQLMAAVRAAADWPAGASVVASRGTIRNAKVTSCRYGWEGTTLVFLTTSDGDSVCFDPEDDVRGWRLA